MRARWGSVARAVVLALSLSGCGAATTEPTLWADSFDEIAPWTAHPASDVQMALSLDEGRPASAEEEASTALRIDFTFPGSGWAIARRAVELDMPDNYVFAFWLRGESGPQTLEVKWIDATGENVWWWVRRDFEFTGDWQRIAIKKRQIDFAWGPLGGGELAHAAALEIAVTASSGGTGTVWIDDLSLMRMPLPSITPPRPVVTASTEADGHAAAAASDSDLTTSWSPAVDDVTPQLSFDLVEVREFGGVLLDWTAGAFATDYDLELSDDGMHWRPLARVRHSKGGRDIVHAPESEARWLRLTIVASVGSAGPAPALAELTLQPVEWAVRRDDLFAEIAGQHRRGAYPRAYLGEQSYWTVVGTDGASDESLMSEDGAIEVGPWQPTLEPFIEVDGTVFTWADVQTSCSLVDDDLPLPRVHWTRQGPRPWTLDIEATPLGDAVRSAIAVRYRFTNESDTTLAPVLHLALRPFQVNPPVQFLNRPGGIAPNHRLSVDAQGFRIEGRTVVQLPHAPAHRGASTFHAGDAVAEFLLGGELPQRGAVEDSFGAASGFVSYPFVVAPQDSVEITVLLPQGDELWDVPTEARAAQRWMSEQIATSRAQWRQLLDRVEIDLPAPAQWIEDTLRSQIAYVLVNRDGPAIQPGSRSYARSWIRDGALTSSALLRLGHPEPAREFLEWFAPYQFADGKIPCVVDERGGDPVPEHDSSGEFIFLVAELLRYTGDRTLAERMWPRVEAAAAYLDSLRQLRRTPQYTTDEKRVFFGLLPESISHEGYSAKPMHSYWDDFWAVRGFADAAWLAGRLDRPQRREHWQAVLTGFGTEVGASVRRALEVHDIDYVPGCADLGDFDATSTTIALAPTGASAWLPPDALEATFERYWAFFEDRRGGAVWDAYTPYELRNVGAFVHLGWRERAHEALRWFHEHQRPAGWNHWAEVVVHEERTPRFLGDMPHTWVGSDFVRAVLDMFAYVSGENDEELLLGAGILPAWIEAEGGVRVAQLPTPFGTLDFAVQARGAQWQARVSGDLRMPTDGIWLRLPLATPPRSVQVDGVEVAAPTARGLRIERLPATVSIDR